MAWAEKQLKRNAFNEIVPQYFDEALDDWVPYTGVYGEVTLSGNILPGRDIEVVDVWTALALVDTTTQFKDVNLAKYKKVALWCSNTHNADITLQLYRPPGGGGMGGWDGTQWTRDVVAVVLPAELSANVGAVLLNTKWAWLNNTPIENIRFTARAASSPTKGSLSAWAWGVPN